MAIVYAYYGDVGPGRAIASAADFPAVVLGPACRLADLRRPVGHVVRPDASDACARHARFLGERAGLRAAILAVVPDAVERGIIPAGSERG